MQRIVQHFEQWLFLVAVAAVVLVTLSTRLFFLQTFPHGLDQDEAVNGYDAYTLGVSGRDHHGNFLPILLQAFDDWVPALLTYTTIPFVMVLGLSSWSVRLVTGLYGVGAVFLLYVLCRQLQLSKWWSLAGAAILALSGWHVFLSHFAIPPSIVPFYTFLFLLALFYWLGLPISAPVKKKLLWGAAVGLSASLLTHTYSTLNLQIPVFLALCGGVIFFTRRHLLTSFVIVWAVYLAVAGPMLWITMTQSSKYNARFNDITILNRPQPVRVFERQYWQYLSYKFIFGTGDPRPQHQIQGFPLFAPILLLPFVAGGVAVAYQFQKGVAQLRKSKKVELMALESFLLLSWIALSPISTALTKDPYHLLRAIHLLPVLVVIMALGLPKLYQFIASQLRPRTAALSLGMIFGVLLIVFTGYMHTAVTKYPKEVGRFFTSGLENVLPMMTNDPTCTQKVLTDQIAQPYIFQLFYSKRKPDQKLYEQMTEKFVTWDHRTTTPRQIDDIEIRDVTPQELQELTRVHQEQGFLPYALYRSETGKCVLHQDF